MPEGLFKPLVYEPARHLIRLATDRTYRVHSLLASRFATTPRFSPCRARLYGWDLAIPDAASFLSAHREIFVERIYAFPFVGEAPRILDLGANIGLSVLFFKQLYPQAAIMALEADPDIFRYLQQNVHGNGFRDVELVNRAAWFEEGTVSFRHEGADGGFVASADGGGERRVEAVDVAAILRERHFDFLKMDIEGAEEFILPSCTDSLANIGHIFVEYHSRPGRRQCLQELVDVFSRTGHRIHIHSLHPSPSPFTELDVRAGFDMQLNIFAWKEPC